MSHLLVDPRIPLRSDGSSPDTADRIKAILAGILYDITPSKTKALAGTGKDTAEPPPGALTEQKVGRQGPSRPVST